MINEFKAFISKGNIIDLAVAVVIGAAFAPVVSTFVARIVMPLIGMIVGQPNFDTVGTFACEPLTDDAGTLIVNGMQQCAGSVGAVLTIILNFVIVALAVFLVVKAYNKTKAPEPEAAPAGPSEKDLLAEIAATLKAQSDAMGA